MNGFVDSYAYWLADSYLLSTILLIASLAAMWFTKQPVKRLAVAKSALVAIALMAVLCALPGWSVVHLLAGRTSVPPTIERSKASSTISMDAAAPVVPLDASEDRSVAQLSLSVTQHDASSAWAVVSPMTLFSIVHLAGSTCALAWLGLGTLAARRLVHDSRPAPIELSRLIAPIAPANGRAFDLLVSDRIDVAVAIGATRPCVVLPHRWVDDRSAEELQAVLAHEVAHVENGDLAWLAVGRSLLILLWAQPLFWLLRRSLRLDQETLADAAAAEVSGRQAYAEQLVAWARDVMPRRRPSLPASVGLWEGASQLRRRVAVLVDERFTVLKRCSRVWLCGALAGTVSFAAFLSTLTIAPITVAVASPDENKTPLEAETQHQSLGGGTVTRTVAGNPATPWDYEPNAVRLEVEDAVGKPVAGVEATLYRVVQATGEREQMREATSTENGVIEFREVVASNIAAEFQQKLKQGQFPGSVQEIFYIVLKQPGMGTVILPASDFTVVSRGVQRGVRMRLAAELTGRVTDSQGKPVEGATVAAGSAAGFLVLEGANAMRTDADGRYRFTDRVAFDRKAADMRIAEQNQWATAAERDMSKLYPAVYDPVQDTSVSDLVVTHPDYAVTTVRGGDVPGTADVVMAPAAAIEGRVVEFGTGRPAAGVQIRAVGRLATVGSQDGSRRVGNALPQFGSVHSAQTHTDVDGHYRMVNLPAGTYEVWTEEPTDDWRKSKWVSRGVTGIDAVAGERVTTVPDIVIGPGGTIRGQLIDAATGKSLVIGAEGASLRAGFLLGEPQSQQTLPMQRVNVTTDGEFELRAVPGKLRVFLVVDLHEDAGHPQGDFRSVDDVWKSGQLFDLKHGESTTAKFHVLSNARIEALRVKSGLAYELLNKGDFDEAIAVFTEFMEEDPRNTSVISARAWAEERANRDSEAVVDYTNVLKMAPDDLGAMMRLADLLATSTDKSVRDGDRAVELADIVLASVRGSSRGAEAERGALVLLAAAQAEAGDFDAAVATQRQVIDRAPDSVRADMSERLKLYEAGKPYRRAADGAGAN